MSWPLIKNASWPSHSASMLKRQARAAPCRPVQLQNPLALPSTPAPSVSARLAACPASASLPVQVSNAALFSPKCRSFQPKIPNIHLFVEKKWHKSGRLMQNSSFSVQQVSYLMKKFIIVNAKFIISKFEIRTPGASASGSAGSQSVAFVLQHQHFQS